MVDFGDAGFGFVREIGAGANEIGVVVPDEALLLGRELISFGRFVDGLDAGKQRGVLVDLVLQRRELGLHLGLDFAKLVGRHGGGPDPVDGGGAVEGLAGALHGGDGVFEVGGLGVRSDGVDVGERLRYARF